MLTDERIKEIDELIEFKKAHDRVGAMIGDKGVGIITSALIDLRTEIDRLKALIPAPK